VVLTSHDDHHVIVARSHVELAVLERCTGNVRLGPGQSVEVKDMQIIGAQVAGELSASMYHPLVLQHTATSCLKCGWSITAMHIVLAATYWQITQQLIAHKIFIVP